MQTPEEGTVELGYQHNLYLLAFDHRGSFQKGCSASGNGPPTPRSRRSSTP